MNREYPEPALITMMTTEDGSARDAAFLRTYAVRVRDRTSATWEIPNSVASTLEGIARRIEEREYYPKALGLVADELERLTPDRLDDRRMKLVAVIRNAASRGNAP